MQLYKNGIKVKELKKLLSKMDEDKYLYVGSDEELNNVFKGVFFDEYADCLIVAGLTGFEIKEE